VQSKGNASPSQRERSSSPQDMDISDSESEDGQISKTDQEEERLMGLTGGYDAQRRTRPGAKDDAAEEPCSLAALEACRLTRDAIAKHHIKPWFQDYVTGGLCRFFVETVLTCARCLGEISHWYRAKWGTSISDMSSEW
jgi:RNA polymerase-associated protein RTF1